MGCAYTICLYGIIIIPWQFFTQTLTDDLLLASEWQQVFSSLQHSFQYSNNAVVWIVTSCLLISKWFTLFTNPLGKTPSVPIKIGITVTFMFNSFSSQAKSKYLPIISLFFSFTVWSIGMAKSTIRQVLFFFFYWLSLGLVVWSRLSDLFVSQNPR